MTATAACVAVLTAFATADRALDLHPITPPAGITDTDRVLRVKAALAADPELRFVPLLVSVSDGVAVIGGPVPSLELLPRIEQAATGVPGISGVRTGCWLAATEDPLKRLAAARVRKDAPPDPRPPATVVAAKAMPPMVTSFLLDPSAPTPTIPPTAVPMRPDLASEVERLRSTDRRFAGLTVRVRDGQVIVHGSSADGDVWDFAEVVRVLPGVRRVVVGP